MKIKVKFEAHHIVEIAATILNRSEPYSDKWVKAVEVLGHFDYSALQVNDMYFASFASSVDKLVPWLNATKWRGPLEMWSMLTVEQLAKINFKATAYTGQLSVHNAIKKWATDNSVFEDIMYFDQYSIVTYLELVYVRAPHKFYDLAKYVNDLHR